MRNPRLLKIASCILMQNLLALNFCFAFTADGSKYKCDTLAPALQIGNNIPLYFKSQYNVDVVKPWDKVDVVLKEQRPVSGSYHNRIEVTFKHDQIGIFDKILDAVGREGQLIWFEMGHKKDKKLFRFAVSTKSKENRGKIVENIKKIDDLPQKAYEKGETVKWVLNLNVQDRVTTLKDVTRYLSVLHINVANFLTPNVKEEGKAQFVFELDVPVYINVSSLKKRLYQITKGGDRTVQFTPGQLIDKILNEYLVKKINVEINNPAKKKLRLALKTVAMRHISQARKDRITPFIMHPVEIAKIVVNEIEMLSPDMIVCLSQALKIKKEEVILTVLLSTILHDAVEDGDINHKPIEKKFGKLISEIVFMLTKEARHKSKKGEVEYLKRLVRRKDAIGLVAQVLKIADRMHNLRSLKYNKPEFQRKVIFSTIDNFVPYFISQIELENIKNSRMRRLLEKSIFMFNQQLVLTLKDIGFLDSKNQIDPAQRVRYEWEEKLRLNPKVLALAEEKNIIAHGVSAKKEGIDALGKIILQGYIKARSTNVGMAVFAGQLRPQRPDEDHDDYQAESPGDYGPYYVILDPKINNLRLRINVEKRKVVLPGYYQAMQVSPNVWGYGSDLHLAYLVPANTDRQYIAKQMLDLVRQGRIDSKFALKAVSKIMTYDEFLENKGSLKKNSGVTANQFMTVLRPDHTADSI